MKFYTRKLIRPTDLNANNTLFGGSLLKWIDEEAGIYAMSKLNTQQVVTKYISEIDFISSATQGDIVQIGLEFIKVGQTSITFACEVRNFLTKTTIIKVDKVVFVKIGKDGRPSPHGLSNEDIRNSTVNQFQ